ncbi:MAG TPA: SDR family NAD(P)-dependent oxidoreductase, partial [Thermodesulfobacteriota bacterium]|nr:SDR family NAD(P)-dependent oxidoreductase [Thermodesulfobacteriota bacterium]
MRLKDNVACVTGAGRGIREAIALLFAEEEANVVIKDVHETDAKSTVEGIKGRGGQSSYPNRELWPRFRDSDETSKFNGVKARYLTNLLDNPAICSSIGDAAIGHFISTLWLPTIEIKENKDFLERWRKKFKGTKDRCPAYVG